jgi:hypothetical protein
LISSWTALVPGCERRVGSSAQRPIAGVAAAAPPAEGDALGLPAAEALAPAEVVGRAVGAAVRVVAEGAALVVGSQASAMTSRRSAAGRVNRMSRRPYPNGRR